MTDHINNLDISQRPVKMSKLKKTTTYAFEKVEVSVGCRVLLSDSMTTNRIGTVVAQEGRNWKVLWDNGTTLKHSTKSIWAPSELNENAPKVKSSVELTDDEEESLKSVESEIELTKGHIVEPHPDTSGGILYDGSEMDSEKSRLQEPTSNTENNYDENEKAYVEREDQVSSLVKSPLDELSTDGHEIGTEPIGSQEHTSNLENKFYDQQKSIDDEEYLISTFVTEFSSDFDKMDNLPGERTNSSDFIDLLYQLPRLHDTIEDIDIDNLDHLGGYLERPFTPDVTRETLEAYSFLVKDISKRSEPPAIIIAWIMSPTSVQFEYMEKNSYHLLEKHGYIWLRNTKSLVVDADNKYLSTMNEAINEAQYTVIDEVISEAQGAVMNEIISEAHQAAMNEDFDQTQQAVMNEVITEAQQAGINDDIVEPRHMVMNEVVTEAKHTLLHDDIVEPQLTVMQDDMVAPQHTVMNDDIVEPQHTVMNDDIVEPQHAVMQDEIGG
jgi:DNA-binding transcriptional regulator YhcF (GntR family)